MIRDFDLLCRLVDFDHLDALPRRTRRQAVQLLRQAFTDEIAITVATVAQSTNADAVDGLAGATITQGQSVYLGSAGLWLLAQCDGTAPEAGSGGVRNFGIALNAALSGQPLKIQVGGLLTIGAVLTVGLDYCIGRVAGGICPRTSLASTDKITHLGYAETAGVLNMASKRYYGLAVP